jgi:hypothetical protein
MAMAGKHCMVSFAHPSQAAMAAELCQSFTLDNGAFSAWKTKRQLDVGKLADWVSQWLRHPSCDWYCIPDTIGGDEHENAAMRAKWFNQVSGEVWRKGVPIWHLHEPLEVLRNFLTWPSPAIALGSSGEFATIGTRRWWSRMAEAMETVCDEDGYPKKKIHGLRMLDPTIFSHFPFSSADSTNVARNVGIDKKWAGPYAPASRKTRALILMERIENHAAASRWAGSGGGAMPNQELFG